MDSILDLFFSFLGGSSFFSGLVSFGIVGAIVYTLASRFFPYGS
jgi:hypothetical protein